MNQAGRDHSRACRCIRAVISPSSAKCAPVSAGSSAEPPGSVPGRNSNLTQYRSAAPPCSGTVTTRRPSAAGSTRGVRTPASVRNASIQASSEAISCSV